ncbi:hypothetical protein AVEN_84457-1 [Araneus ventricosus]|uniref:Uncharacterized protein n=1 Tax=Araneus ventricosus TaxID=182803 RepID=A0A4Y2VL75_ARAVE|nr:hypothetical protein AVEN_84457-1 [Araneus ventricosus]
MSRLDESRWKKHGERYATAITDDRGNASRLRSSMHDREQLLFAARVNIKVYDASGNIVHIAGMGRNNHKIFILLGGSRQEGGDNPFVQEGFGPCRWLNNVLFVVICAFYCRKTEGQANSSFF